MDNYKKDKYTMKNNIFSLKSATPRKIATASFLSLSILAVSACGGNTPNEASSNNSPEASVASTSAPAQDSPVSRDPNLVDNNYPVYKDIKTWKPAEDLGGAKITVTAVSEQIDEVNKARAKKKLDQPINLVKVDVDNSGGSFAVQVPSLTLDTPDGPVVYAHMVSAMDGTDFDMSKNSMPLSEFNATYLKYKDAAEDNMSIGVGESVSFYLYSTQDYPRIITTPRFQLGPDPVAPYTGNSSGATLLEPAGHNPSE